MTYTDITEIKATLMSWVNALAALLTLFAVVASAQTPAQRRRDPQPASENVHGTVSLFRLPEGAVNYALKSSGARASASSTAVGFDPDGALDGIWTAQGWGKGHGWQNATRHEYPSWLEVQSCHAKRKSTPSLSRPFLK